jgi:hypothetical protein
MVVKQCLVVITLVQGVSRHLYRFGKVTKGEVKHVYFMVSRLIVQHDVEVLVVSLLFTPLLVFWSSDNCCTWALLLLLFDQSLFLFLVGRDYLLDFVLQLDDWRSNLCADPEKEV